MNLLYRYKHILDFSPVVVFLAAALFLAFQPGMTKEAGEGEVIKGRVVGVIDGDTLDILTPEKEKIRIRLSGIDAPEKSQPFGKKAKKFLSHLAFDCTASVKVVDTDIFKRKVGLVHACGSNVNEEMIRNGYAWVYRNYVDPKHKSRWIELEQQAKKARKGLWGGSEDPIEPWRWRKGERMK